MNRRVFIASAASFACTARLSANQQSATRRADTLAVYRDVLNKTCACCATNNDISVIDQRPSLPPLPRLDARAFSPMQKLTMPEAMEPYLSPPADQTSNAEEMLRDLVAQYALPVQRFDEELTLTAPHMFVSASDKRQLMRFHPQNQIFSQKIEDEAHAVPKSLQKRFAHAGTMYSVSPVGFNLDVNHGCTSGSLQVVVDVMTSSGRCLNGARALGLGCHGTRLTFLSAPELSVTTSTQRPSLSRGPFIAPKERPSYTSLR